MESAVFRTWLRDRGCRLQWEDSALGQMTMTARLQGRCAELPLDGPHARLEPEKLRAVCDRLGLDWRELPEMACAA